MIYIRTESDLNAYIKENNVGSDVNAYFEETLSYSYVGKFVSIDRNTISTYLSQGFGNSGKSAFAISDEVIDLVVNGKILSDSSVKEGENYTLEKLNMTFPKSFGDTVEMFAKTEKGVITDLIAVNHGNLLNKRLGIPTAKNEVVQ